MALDFGPAVFGTTGSHPTQVPAEFSTLRPSANPKRERSNPVRTLRGMVKPTEQVPTAGRTGRDRVRSQGRRESRRIC
jgi:hypothetical protein